MKSTVCLLMMKVCAPVQFAMVLKSKPWFQTVTLATTTAATPALLLLLVLLAACERAFVRALTSPCSIPSILVRGTAKIPAAQTEKVLVTCASAGQGSVSETAVYALPLSLGVEGLEALT